MRPWLAVALLCQLGLSLGYAWTTPAFEGPDENDHAYYASHLAHRRSLPIVLRSAKAIGGSPWDEASLGHHPPLYYTLLAITMHAAGAPDTIPSWKNAADGDRPTHHWRHGYDEVAPVSAEITLLRLLRGWSVLCGLASVLLTHRLGRLLVPTQPGVADAAALLLACLPQWSFMHGVLDNGNLASTLGLATLVLLAGCAVQGRVTRARAAALGVTIGLALITKLTCLFLLPVAGTAWLWLLWRDAPRRGATFGAGMLTLALTGLSSAWFFVRNALLYGDALAVEAHRAAYATNRVPEDLKWGWLFGDFGPQLGTSLVGNFGWMSLAAPWPWLVVVAGAALAALLGWIWRGRRLGAHPAVLLLTLATAALVAAQVLRFNWDFFQPQGRYLFPAAGALAVLVAAGLAALPAVPTGLRVLLGGALPVGAVATLAFHFAPAFAVEPGAGVAREYASMVAGLATPVPPERQQIEALEPADGAELTAPPTFRWRASLGPAARYTVHMFNAEGRVLFGTHEWAGTAFDGDHWPMPEAYWAMIPMGEELWWKIRRLPDRAAHESVEDVEESPPRRLVRR